MRGYYLGKACTVLITNDREALIQVSCGKQTRWVDKTLIKMGGHANGKESTISKR